MTDTTGKFAPTAEQDVTRIVLEHPFAWLVTIADGALGATPLPLRPEVDSQGSVAALLGHFARRNPQVEQLKRSPRALALFMGPHGYISSSWLEDRSRSPTWNYAIVQYVVDVEFVEDDAGTVAIMDDMIGAMEAGRPNAWSAREMGARYERLASGIIAFRAVIRGRRATFKLGQDERDSEYLDITRTLRTAGNVEMLEWMQRANPSRPCG